MKHESGINWEQHARVSAVQAVAADPLARPPVVAMLATPKIPVIIPDTWDVGLAKLKRVIVADTRSI